MPRGPDVAMSPCNVSNAEQDLSYFCMWVCSFLKRLTRLSEQLASACLEHQGIVFHCSNIKLSFQVPHKRRSMYRAMAATELWLQSLRCRASVAYVDSSSAA